MFKPMNTENSEAINLKVLMYGQAGVGKTTQAKYLQEAAGKGFILSGESGLSSIRSAHIDYLPFNSYDGENDPAKGVWSFMGIVRAMQTEDFRKQGYKWIMLDSLTELSDLIYDHCEKAANNKGEKKNGFQLWGDYAALMLRSCKFIRDLPYTVVISALEKTEEDDNGRTVYRPMVKGNGVSNQLPGLFDFVFNLVASVSNDQPPVTVRRIVTSTVGGRLAKARDEHQALESVENTASIVDILRKVTSSK